MDWAVIGENIVSESISGIIVTAVCGFIAWLIYELGIRGKEHGQRASERKENIYIPLKNEMRQIATKKEDLWGIIKCPQLSAVVEKYDEVIPDDELYKESQVLLDMIDEYNSIDSYKIAGDLLVSHLRSKYIEMYGKTTRTIKQWEEQIQDEVIIEEEWPELGDFYSRAYLPINIDPIIKIDQDYEEYCASIEISGPLQRYLTSLFASALPKLEPVINKEIKEQLEKRNISQAMYVAKTFHFWDEFYKNESVIRKQNLLISIKENSLEIHEHVSVKIRKIVKKYELE